MGQVRDGYGTGMGWVRDGTGRGAQQKILKKMSTPAKKLWNPSSYMYVCCCYSKM